MGRELKGQVRILNIQTHQFLEGHHKWTDKIDQADRDALLAKFGGRP